jgi:hypothetical protein
MSTSRKRQTGSSASRRSRHSEEIKQRYTFFSHVGLALANWRQVRPADFWREWEAQHPFVPEEPDEDGPQPDADAS